MERERMEILERNAVIAALHDRLLLVPAAHPPAAAESPGAAFARFRADASRFVNGRAHDRRRAHLEALLAALDPAALGAAAGSRAGAALDAGAAAESLAATVPVAALAERLDFADVERVSAAVAVVAEHYRQGIDPDASGAAFAADAAIGVLLAASPDDDPADSALRIQLLVQAHAATEALIRSGLGRLEASDQPAPSTHRLLAEVLREQPPVPTTARIAPGGEVIVLHLDAEAETAEDTDADAPADRALAFGAGPRRCPAPHHALAIAAAVIDAARDRQPSTHTEVHHAHRA